MAWHLKGQGICSHGIDPISPAYLGLRNERDDLTLHELWLSQEIWFTHSSGNVIVYMDKLLRNLQIYNSYWIAKASQSSHSSKDPFYVKNCIAYF